MNEKYYVVNSSVVIDVTFECQAFTDLTKRLDQVKDELANEIKKKVGSGWDVKILSSEVKVVDDSLRQKVYGVRMRIRFVKLVPDARPFYFVVSEADLPSGVSGAVTTIIVLGLILALVLAVPFSIRRVVSLVPIPDQTTPEGKTFWQNVGYGFLFLGIGILLFALLAFAMRLKI